MSFDLSENRSVTKSDYLISLLKEFQLYSHDSLVKKIQITCKEIQEYNYICNQQNYLEILKNLNKALAKERPESVSHENWWKITTYIESTKTHVKKLKK